MDNLSFRIDDFRESINNRDFPLLRLDYSDLKSPVTFDLLRLEPTKGLKAFEHKLLQGISENNSSVLNHQQMVEASRERDLAYCSWLIKTLQVKINAAGIRELDEEEQKFVYPEIKEENISSIPPIELDTAIVKDLQTRTNLSWIKQETIKFIDLILGGNWYDYKIYRLQNTSWCAVNYSDYSPQELNTYFIIHNSGKEIWLLFLNLFWN